MSDQTLNQAARQVVDALFNDAARLVKRHAGAFTSRRTRTQLVITVVQDLLKRELPILSPAAADAVLDELARRTR